MNDIEKAINNMASDLVKATLSYSRNELISEAQSKLNTSRNDYISGVSAVYMEDDLNGKITLKGTWPVMVEEGFGPFDEKQGFFKSPKKKESQDGGWYLTIPYRHRTSGPVNVMPNNIKKYASKLDHKEVLIQSIINELGYKPQTSWTGYTWSNSKYDGLQRMVKEYTSGKKHGQYITFRRVSDKSNPKSWQHPGYKGLKAFDTVTPKAETFAYEYWEELL